MPDARSDVAIDPAELPRDLVAALGGGRLVPVAVGDSGATIARVVVDGGTDRFLKLVEHASDAPALTAEIDRLDWLAGQLPVPEVVAHGDDGRVAWLVTTALAGADASVTDLATDVGRLAALLGDALRSFHEALDVASCPFDGRTSTLLAHARRRVEAAAVDPEGFEPVNQGSTPAELLAMVERTRPDDPADLVVTHGDYCLPNVLVDGGSVSGYVDVGLVGVGDRYRDLGIGSRSVARNLGAGAIGPFLEGYGIDWPDLARIDFFVNLDDLF